MSAKDCPRLAGAVFCFLLAVVAVRAADPVATGDAPAARVAAAVPSTTPNIKPDVSKLMTEAQTQFIPIAAAELEQSKSALVAATRRLDAFLRGDAARRRAGRASCCGTDLQTQLSAATPTSTRLRTVQERFASVNSGLELSTFHDVTVALRQYVNRAAFAANPQAADEYAANMQTIRSGIDAYLKNSSSTELLPVAEAVASLEGIGRNADLVRQVRDAVLAAESVVPSIRELHGRWRLASGRRGHADQRQPQRYARHGHRSHDRPGLSPSSWLMNSERSSRQL